MNPEELTGTTPAVSEEEGAPQDVNVPLGTGDFADQSTLDPLAGARKTRRLNGGVALIVAVVLIAVAGLFSMRKLAQVTAAVTTDSDIESRIESFLAQIGISTGQSSDAETNSVLATARANSLAVLRDNYSERQVPLSDVQKNPFIIDSLVPVVALPDDSSDNPPGADAEKLFLRMQVERRDAFEQAGSRLALKSVLGGSTPLAIIDDKIVRIGDTIVVGATGVEFRVQEIAASSVDLVAEAPELGLEVTITLQIARDL